jgi:hypothetical protein
MSIMINQGYRYMNRVCNDNMRFADIANILRRYRLFNGPIMDGMRLYADEQAARQKVAEASKLARRVVQREAYRGYEKMMKRNYCEEV